jgi:isoquinoline 1-oxidoreductase beta subunit
MALGKAAKRIEAVYETPYLAHQTLEPQNMTAWIHDGLCEVWGGTQAQTIAENAAQAASKLDAAKIRIHTTYLGGGLGRRSEFSDAFEAVELAAMVKAPVKIIWTREEDMQHDFYRPMTVNAMKAGLDEKGNLVAFNARLAGQSIFARRAPQVIKARKGIDPQSVECAVNMPYDIPNRLIEQCTIEAHVPVGFWRSVGASQNLFVVESFIDELAHAAGRDPFEFRRAMMGGHPRFKALLEMAAGKAGWGSPLPKGVGRGIAIGESFSGVVAQVAEVSVDDKGGVKLKRVVAACDFGTVVHPGLVKSQVQSSIVTGIDQTFFNRITIKNGAVEQGNFDTNNLPRITDVPPIEVHLIQSELPPGGVGEPAVPPLAPAVANAIFAVTGKRVRRLPITPDMLKS